MKNYSSTSLVKVSAFQPTSASLQLLLQAMIRSSQHLAGNNNSIVMNEVSHNICLAAENQKMIPIINELLRTVIANSRNSQICITAERFRDIVILEIQDRNNFNGYALGFSIQTIEPDAANAGACLQFNGQKQKVATVSFSFSNYAA